MPQTAFEGRPQMTAERVIDLRADGATRTVHVTASGVTIERSIEGVRMRVGVPIAAYRGLVLAVREASETATLTLRHADQDLDVALGSGDALDVARAAKDWADLLGQPIEIQVASVPILASQPRRQGRDAVAAPVAVRATAQDRDCRAHGTVLRDRARDHRAQLMRGLRPVPPAGREQSQGCL